MTRHKIIIGNLYMQRT